MPRASTGPVSSTRNSSRPHGRRRRSSDKNFARPAVVYRMRAVAVPVGARSFPFIRRIPGIRVRIAQIAPLYEAVPPQLYGGTERVVAHLADALVELGHDVTLFASSGAGTRAEVVAMRDQ